MAPRGAHKGVFRLHPPPDGFVSAPPFSFDHDLLLAGRPDQVFDVLVNIEHEARWFPDFREAEWLEPPGVGAVRDYRLTYMRLLEIFTVWQPGLALEFWVSAWSIPMLRHFMESYRFDPAGANRTRLRWRVAYQPPWYLRPLHPIVRPLFARDFRTAAHQLMAYCEELFGDGTAAVSPTPRDRAPGACPADATGCARDD